MATFWILAYSGPNSLSSALSTTGSYFGAVATLGAAVIAAHLFNDWRIIKQYEIILNYVLIIKKQVQEFISFINTNRNNFIKYKLRIKEPNLKLEEFQLLHIEINKLEREIINRLNHICLEMNELYYLKNKRPEDPITTELVEKIKYFNNIGIHQNNYYDIWEKRLTTLALDEYFEYITDDLINFVYNKIMGQYLDDLILETH